VNAANILVVDDEPQIRRVLRSTLSAQGYVIVEAKTGEEALESMRKERPDLVLLDMNMPGMGGVEACREIRRASDAPIIMLTVRNAETIMSSSHLGLKNCWLGYARPFAGTRRAMRFHRFSQRI
jgi:CheY-like chemotaxis protein